MAEYLYSRDSKDKVRVLIVSIFLNKNELLGDSYEIRRESGLLDGTLTKQPVKTISKGKVNRTLMEQVQLEVRSIVNKQRDKGYKLLTELTDEDIDPMDHVVIDELLAKGKTYASGRRKLMLAKDPKGVSKYYDKQKKPVGKGWNRKWLVSRKLDGIRSEVFLEGGDLTKMSLKAITRNGKDVPAAFTKVFSSSKWKKFFEVVGADTGVDGEMYIHGRSLQSLSGDFRKEEYVPERHDDLEFWIFDLVDDTKTAIERAKLLDSLKDHFDIVKDKVYINEQFEVENDEQTYERIKVLHDLWVGEGFEGAICRAADSLYGFGTRDDRMIKVKEFQDDEFEITGMKEGLRGAEDMCFKCVTPDGKPFEAKPMGKREVKLAYAADIDNIIGKMVTVKFFNYTEEGVPFLPVATVIRDYE